MNYVADSYRLPVRELLYSINQNTESWKPVSGTQAGILSISVFGAEGSRYSILVMEKDHLRSDYAGKDGNWLLSGNEDAGSTVKFVLEWAVEAAGSGCLVLCGKETPIPFNNSA